MTAKKVWKKLFKKTTFADKGQARQITLVKQLQLAQNWKVAIQWKIIMFQQLSGRLSD